MKVSGLLDITNSIAVFQLIFFTIYLFIKGKKIPSTHFLKIHLFFQLISYINYFYFSREYEILKPLLILSMPVTLLWAPTFYFYIRSRLFTKFVPEPRLVIHAIPAILVMIYILFLLAEGKIFTEHISELGRLLYFLYKVQLLVYNIYSLFLIYKYRHGIKFQTSANEDQKLNWLLLITYGITINSTISFVLNFITGFSTMELGYYFFFIFINVFFFKAIIQPDQFLGFDEKKLLPVRLPENKSKSYFTEIEGMINDKQLFLDPDLSLNNVARVVRLSDRVVSQVIKQNFDLNFSDYINKNRIDYAKQVLLTTSRSEKNVLEVLYEAGFNSKSVFNTQFKKHTGVSPTEFRELNRK